MKSKQIFLLILSGLFISGIFCQEIKWSKAANWKLYKIQDKKSFSYSVDTLTHFKSVGLNIDSMNRFMANVTLWPKDKYSLWMGSYVISCEIDGIIRKIDVSVYGGFFFDGQTKRYYEIATDLRDEWTQFLNSNGNRL